jgi:hypothetical protein
MNRYAVLLDMPTAGSINTGASPSTLATKTRVLGKPVGRLGVNCNEANAPVEVRRRLKVRQCGRFRIRAIEPWLNVTERALAIVEKEHPGLYACLSYAGSFCARKVRGGRSASTHTWACADDWGIDGVVDRRGDGKVYAGLFILYAAYKRAAKELGYKPPFWGVGFAHVGSRSVKLEDAMHLETSEEMLLDFEKRGLI